MKAIMDIVILPGDVIKVRSRKLVEYDKEARPESRREVDDPEFAGKVTRRINYLEGIAYDVDSRSRSDIECVYDIDVIAVWSRNNRRWISYKDGKLYK